MAVKKRKTKRKSSAPGSASQKSQDVTDRSQGSKPQDTQPVEKLQDVSDAMPEFPIEDYEWKICDMSSDEEANEVSSFLKKYYLGIPSDMSPGQDESDQFEFEYSKDFLRWSLCPPGFQKDWHIGVQDKSTKQLVAFIAAVPTNMRLHGKDMRMAEVKFHCALDKPGSDDLQQILFKEMTRRVYPHSVQSIVYASGDHFSDELITTCQCWSRPLNLKKLFDLKFFTLDDGMTVETELELHSLPTSPPTDDLRKMEAKDVPSVTALLQTYLERFDVAPMFNEAEVEHWFLPRADTVESYVVELENKGITHFISFAILSFSILGNDSTIKSASSLYNVSGQAPQHALLMDALVLAKLNGSDIYEALNIMDNNDIVLEDLKFCSGPRHYYYRRTLSKGLEPSQVGFFMF